MPFDLDSLTDLTQTENDALCDYIGRLPEYQSGTNIIAEKLGNLSRGDFMPDDGVEVLDFQLAHRFSFVPDGGGGMQLIHQFRKSIGLELGPEMVLIPIGEGYYAFPVLEEIAPSDLILSVVKLDD